MRREVGLSLFLAVVGCNEDISPNTNLPKYIGAIDQDAYQFPRELQQVIKASKRADLSTPGNNNCIGKVVAGKSGKRLLLEAVYHPTTPGYQNHHIHLEELPPGEDPGCELIK